MAHDRLANIEKNLKRLQEQLNGEQDTLTTIAPEQRVRIQQLIEDSKSRIRELKVEYWQILARESATFIIPEPEAEVIVAEIVESVDRLVQSQAYPVEELVPLVTLQEKLKEPETPAATKVKWTFTALPPFVSVALERDRDLETFWQDYFPTFRACSKVLAKKL
jgi:DNA repair exonuclease SbcCD ATPase subunit